MHALLLTLVLPVLFTILLSLPETEGLWCTKRAIPIPGSSSTVRSSMQSHRGKGRVKHQGVTERAKLGSSVPKIPWSTRSPICWVSVFTLHALQVCCWSPSGRGIHYHSSLHATRTDAQNQSAPPIIPVHSCTPNETFSRRNYTLIPSYAFASNRPHGSNHSFLPSFHPWKHSLRFRKKAPTQSVLT
jgi:hypothetical protein